MASPSQRPRPAATAPAKDAKDPKAQTLASLALDTLAGVVRSLGEFAQPQEEIEPAVFRDRAEAWANHVAMASPAPGAAPEIAATPGRRDWEGLRRFVRGYCQGSTRHAETVVHDLRQTLWLFIRNLNQAFAADGETDAELRRRLSRLEDLAHAATASDLKREVLAAVGGLGEMIETRHKRHRDQMQNLGQLVRSLGSELESARREGEIDPLTSLINRKGFDEYLARTVEVSGAFVQDATLLLIDIDHFKGINDGHGHTTGDEALRLVSNAVVRVFLRKNDFCARYGGDELAVVLRETSTKEAAALADRVLRAVRAIELTGREGPITVTASIGVGGFQAGDDVKRLIDRADRGLYAAKKAGRNCVQIGE